MSTRRFILTCEFTDDSMRANMEIEGAKKNEIVFALNTQIYTIIHDSYCDPGKQIGTSKKKKEK